MSEVQPALPNLAWIGSYGQPNTSFCTCSNSYLSHIGSHCFFRPACFSVLMLVEPSKYAVIGTDLHKFVVQHCVRVVTGCL
eukprot:scaffold322683_cov24-Prasinocladus_malaysianus.AAC.1